MPSSKPSDSFKAELTQAIEKEYGRKVVHCDAKIVGSELRTLVICGIPNIVFPERISDIKEFEDFDSLDADMAMTSAGIGTGVGIWKHNYPDSNVTNVHKVIAKEISLKKYISSNQESSWLPSQIYTSQSQRGIGHALIIKVENAGEKNTKQETYQLTFQYTIIQRDTHTARYFSSAANTTTEYKVVNRYMFPTFRKNDMHLIQNEIKEMGLDILSFLIPPEAPDQKHAHATIIRALPPIDQQTKQEKTNTTAATTHINLETTLSVTPTTDVPALRHRLGI
jgi:hypothetical protein